MITRIQGKLYRHKGTRSFKGIEYAEFVCVGDDADKVYIYMHFDLIKGA